MRVWLTRLRTALAALAAVYLLWEMPAVVKQLTAPKEDANGRASSAVVLRVWLCEDWTGSGMEWLIKQAGAFEKAQRGVRVVVRRAEKGDWLTEGAVRPDVLLFGAGVIRDPEPLLRPYPGSDPVKEQVASAGDWRGVSYAAPVCYSGPVRLINEANPAGPGLTYASEKEYQEFAAQKAGSLIASVREARRLSALEESGKGFAFRAEPYGMVADRLLMAGAVLGNTGREAAVEAFLSFLLSDGAQNALLAHGLLPASPSAAKPVEAKQPLLFELEKQMERSVNAFDEPLSYAVQ